MSILFVDTSALAKRYLHEKGSAWMLKQLRADSGNTIFIAHLTIVEMTSLLARQERSGLLKIEKAHLLLTHFMIHTIKQYHVVTMGKTIHQQAQRLLWNYPLRSLDAIQLASAVHVHSIVAQPVTFLSSDTRLLNAAKSEGFSVDDPNNY